MKSGDVFVFSNAGELVSKYQRKSIGSDGLFDEKWLQNVIFNNIALIKPTNPIYDRIKIIPLCRELTLNDGIRNLFLDILAITETGRLVLIECKLWKNPQARREVLAQTLEYASLMQTLSYSDLVSKLKQHINSGTEDPITFQFKENNIDFHEELLIDRISQSLKRGDFHLIIAGDGIRTDLVNLVNSRVMTGMTADLSLLELAVHQNAKEEILLSPSVPSETETITRTVLLSAEGLPAIIEEDEVAEVSEQNARSGPTRSLDEDVKAQNNLFWSRAIERIKFDHPDQEPLRRGGNNWCKANMPNPFKWITVYRMKDRIGVFLRYSGTEIEEVEKFFSERIENLKNEVSPEITVKYDSSAKGWSKAVFIGVTRDNVDTLDVETEEEQIEWLAIHLNKFVNYLRPIIHLLPNS